jgi:hypothetical protein
MPTWEYTWGEATSGPRTSTSLEAIGLISIPYRGFRTGFDVTIKDATGLYVSGGMLEVADKVITSNAMATVTTIALNVSTLYYLYASWVANTLTFTLSTTGYTYSDLLGANYFTGDLTKRLISICYTDAGGALYLASNPPTFYVFKDTDNAFNDSDILAYSTTLGGFKGIEKSIDGTMSGNSDDAVPTEKAVKTYAGNAVALAHAAVTVSSPLSLSGQAISVVNNAGTPAQVTAIDTGDMANSDTVVPTSGAVVDYTVPRSLVTGFISGLEIRIKDATTLYVYGGFVEINGEIYQNVARLEVTDGSLTADTLYHVYVDAANSGHTLAAGDFTLSTTGPTYDHSKGAYYMTGDGTKRWLANVHTAA